MKYLRRFTLIFLLILCSSNLAVAQDTEKVADKKFLTLNGVMLASTVFDIETTYAALNNCSACREGNPIMRPFVEKGRPAIYGVEMAVAGGMIYWSYKLKKNGNKLWWLPPIALATGHSIAGISNLRFTVAFLF